MKIQILSDLHHEFLRARGEDIFFHFPLRDEVDVVVLAGDIDKDTHATELIRWLCAKGKQVVYVLGNHEGYSGVEWRDIEKHFEALSVELDGFHFLNRRSVRIGEVEFIGATLWTSGQLSGLGLSRAHVNDACQGLMNDFRIIQMDGDILSFAKSNAEHHKDLKYIDIALSQSKAQKKVVVTHHLPHPRSIDLKYIGSPLNAAFASEVPEDIIEAADVFIHGHTHSNADYMIGKTRVVCNPRGYPKRGGGYENSNFNPEMIIDV